MSREIFVCYPRTVEDSAHIHYVSVYSKVEALLEIDNIINDKHKVDNVDTSFVSILITERDRLWTELVEVDEYRPLIETNMILPADENGNIISPSIMDEDKRASLVGAYFIVHTGRRFHLDYSPKLTPLGFSSCALIWQNDVVSREKYNLRVPLTLVYAVNHFSISDH